MEDSLSCEKDPRSNPVVSPSLSSQGAAEWFGGGTTPFEELLSLLPLQTRHVERSEQEDSKGIAPPPAGRRTLNLPADPLCVRERPVGARSLPELCLFFFFSSSLKLAPFRGSLCFATGAPSCLLVCMRKTESELLQARRFSGRTDLSQHFASLTELLYREKRVIFVLLLSVPFFFFFFWGAMFSDRLESSWFCVRVCVCVRVCLSECVGVCIYISVRGCVARSWWQEAPFFSNKETWRQPKIFFC